MLEIMDSMEYDGVAEHSAENFAKEFKGCLLRAKKNLEDDDGIF